MRQRSQSTQFQNFPEDYPTLFRTAPPNNLLADTAAQALAAFELTDVCFLGQPKDAWSADFASVFASAAKDSDLTVLVEVTTAQDNPTAEEAEDAINELIEYNCRVVVIAAQGQATRALVTAGTKLGAVGPESGWAWLFGYADASIREDTALKGSFFLDPLIPSGPR